MKVQSIEVPGARRGTSCAGGPAEPFSFGRTLGADDVLVRVTHCSLARGDVQFIGNEWGDTRSLVDVVAFTDVNRAIDAVRRSNTVARTVLQR